MAIVTATNFLEYNVYRSYCSRFGFTDPDNPNSSYVQSQFEMNGGDGKELYLEFEKPQIISQGLPAGIGENGLAVEIHFHFFAKSTSSDIFGTNFYRIGICDDKIAANASITHNNLPYRNYSRRDPGNMYGDGTYSNFYSGIGEPLVTTSISEATLVSYLSYCPVDVLKAIENTALVLTLKNSPSYNLYSNVFSTEEYTPYVEIVYGTIKPTVAAISPTSGYVSPYSAIRLSWENKTKDYTEKYNGIDYPARYIIGGENRQVSASIKIKIDDEAENTLFLNSSNPYYDLVLEDKNIAQIKWSVSINTETGQSSAYTTACVVITIDSIPVAVAIYPKNTYVNVENETVFHWSHVNATGSPQKKYELQVLIGTDWITLQESETSATEATILAVQLSAQITAWRVRTANNDGVYGEYSDPAKVVFIITPSVSGITITGNVKPLISWQAAEQQGYEVMIDDVSTGVRYGTEKSYGWKGLLTDGVHAVKVRVANRYGLYSAWVEVSHTVSNVPPETVPELYATALANSDVRLEWTGYTGAETLIYRDGIVIDKITKAANTYVDHTATKRHSYRVRAADADSNYTDSNEVRIAVPLRETMLAAVGEWNWIELAYSATAEPPVRTAELAPLYALNYYSGREKPVAEMSRHKSATYSVTYAVTEQQAAQLRSMMGKIVVHKRKGELIRGLLQSVSETRTWWGVDLTLQIVEVDEG